MIGVATRLGNSASSASKTPSVNNNQSLVVTIRDDANVNNNFTRLCRSVRMAPALPPGATGGFRRASTGLRNGFLYPKTAHCSIPLYPTMTIKQLLKPPAFAACSPQRLTLSPCRPTCDAATPRQPRDKSFIAGTSHEQRLREAIIHFPPSCLCYQQRLLRTCAASYDRLR